MENEKKILSEDRRGIWFPLTVALACFIVAMIIMIYILNMASGIKYEYVELVNGYRLVIDEDSWITDKEGVSIIPSNVTKINVSGGKIFYRRESEDETEVGCFDTEQKYFISRNNEDYEKLEKDFIAVYNVELVDIEEYKQRDK